ncbi:beta strand repeat-containing protein [Brevifollis gellanilyticus]|uniref:Uncharacterized protein n=1 Tax=Brevifollis gellanilyticus TaxID=748831 RepID=A0A512MBY2_9BACT|nr:hypothetical protein [Brevifollis gellanilyticus]GEP44260.1 hypothetical protein BGE01nite_35510 [Brevifollis gellanilyticus]
MKNSPQPSSVLETLESRLAPAGVVALSLTASGALTITGDALSNDFQITESGNDWTIASQAGGDTLFRLNGGAVVSSITFDAPLSVSANLGAGNDKALFSATLVPGNLLLDAGAGDDTVDLTDVSIGGTTTVRMGIGHDYFTAGGDLFFAKAVSVDLGTGQNTFDVNADSLLTNAGISAVASGSAVELQTFILAAEVADVRGAITLRTTTASSTDFEIGALTGDSLKAAGIITLASAGGSDNVTLTGDIETLSTLAINLGSGDNKVVTGDAGLIKANALTYVGGAHKDNVTFYNDTLQVAKGMSFSGGAGENLLDLFPVTSLSIGGALSYVGGTGNDTLLVDGPSVAIGGLVSMGASSGNNAFGLNAVLANVGGVSFSAGVGNDTVDVGQFEGDSSLVTVRGNVSISTGSGSADVMVRDADIYGNLAISTAVVLGGIDTVQLLDSDFRGTVGINLAGSAHSDVVVRDGIFDRAVTINTGGGDDYVAFDTDTEVSSIYSVFDGYVRINLGAGTDIFAAGSNPAVDTVGNDFNSYIDVNGGAGYDYAYFMHHQYNNGFNGPLPWTYAVEEYY